MRAFKEGRNCLETPTVHEKEYEEEERENDSKRESEKISDDVICRTNSNFFSYNAICNYMYLYYLYFYVYYVAYKWKVPLKKVNNLFWNTDIK